MDPTLQKVLRWWRGKCYVVLTIYRPHVIISENKKCQHPVYIHIQHRFATLFPTLQKASYRGGNKKRLTPQKKKDYPSLPPSLPRIPHQNKCVNFTAIVIIHTFHDIRGNHDHNILTVALWLYRTFVFKATFLHRFIPIPAPPCLRRVLAWDFWESGWPTCIGYAPLSLRVPWRATFMVFMEGGRGGRGGGTWRMKVSIESHWSIFGDSWFINHAWKKRNLLESSFFTQRDRWPKEKSRTCYARFTHYIQHFVDGFPCIWRDTLHCSEKYKLKRGTL